MSQLFFQALTLPLNLQPWFKYLWSLNDCLFVCAHQGLFSLWSLLLNYTGSFGIAFPLPQLQIPPGLPCLSLWKTPFGVTDAFAASHTCLSSSWTFGHLQLLQMKLPSFPTVASVTPSFKWSTSVYPSLTLTITLLLPLLCVCCFVYKEESLIYSDAATTTLQSTPRGWACPEVPLPLAGSLARLWYGWSSCMRTMRTGSSCQSSPCNSQSSMAVLLLGQWGPSPRDRQQSYIMLLSWGWDTSPIFLSAVKPHCIASATQSSMTSCRPL